MTPAEKRRAAALAANPGLTPQQAGAYMGGRGCHGPDYRPAPHYGDGVHIVCPSRDLPVKTSPATPGACPIHGTVAVVPQVLIDPDPTGPRPNPTDEDWVIVLDDPIPAPWEVLP